MRQLQRILLTDLRLSRHRHRPPASAPALTNGACQVLNRTSLCAMSLRDSLKTWSNPLGIDLMTTQTGFFPRQLKAYIKR